MAYQSYHKAMLPQTDEISNARHLKMSFMEFLEAMCRAIDNCKPLPILPSIHDHWYLSQIGEDNWALDMKLEAMVPTIIDALKDNRRETRLLSLVRTDVTAHIGTVINVDLSQYQ